MNIMGNPLHWPFQTKILPSEPWSRMKQSPDSRALWANGFSAATSVMVIPPLALDTCSDEGRENCRLEAWDVIFVRISKEVDQEAELWSKHGCHEKLQSFNSLLMITDIILLVFIFTLIFTLFHYFSKEDWFKRILTLSAPRRHWAASTDGKIFQWL